MKAVPQIEFSTWFAWSQRNDLPGCRLPGVYALGHFRRAPKGVADPLGRRVEYIGQSCGQGGVIGRLKLFERAAQTGRANHSGGRTYHRTYGGISDGLCVAAFTVPEFASVEVRNAFIQHVERELIWKFSIAHGQLPTCNRC